MNCPIRAAVHWAVVGALSCPLAALAQEQPAPAPQAAAEAQGRFAAREREALAAARASDTQAFAAGDTVLDRGERLAMLQGEAVRRRAARTHGDRTRRRSRGRTRPGRTRCGRRCPPARRT